MTMWTLLARLRSWFSGVRASRTVNAEMEEEFRLHMELRAADLQRDGFSADDAKRRARAEFGGIHNITQLGREARGLAWFDALRFSWLDFKLGGRMAAKYPGLTVMATLAIGVAVAMGAGVSGALTTIRSESLPLEEGDRIVGIRLVNIATTAEEPRLLHDFAEWRTGLHSVVDVGAFRPTSLNLAGVDGRDAVIQGAEMSAAGFRVARVAPLIGRYLLESDERPSAEPVVVLGYDVWRRRFDADTSVVGRAVRVGTTMRTVVGVMPEKFAFPVNYSMWIPLRLDPLDYERGAGPNLVVFGRLAAGASLDDARSELATRSAVAAHDHPGTHRDLRAQVLPFGQAWLRVDDPHFVALFRTVQIIVFLLVVVICVNVATLVYARTATRQTEIAVRSALGASRTRIVAQLFGEACVLAACGAAVGVSLISLIATQLDRALMRIGVSALVPFWVRFDVSASTLAHVVGLTFLGAVIIGVLPALQLTGPRVQLGLQRLAGGHSTIRMGRLWTALILAEVGFAVTLLPVATRFAGEWVRVASGRPGFPAGAFLSATLVIEGGLPRRPGGNEATAESRSKFAHARDELLARLQAEPGVTGVTYANTVPGGFYESTPHFEVDSVGPVAPAVRLEARLAEVGPRYLELFDLPPIAGRTFVASDADSGASTVIVNRSFADHAFRGTNAIGRRVRIVRYTANGPEPGPWYEIVGVVRDFSAGLPPIMPREVLYRASEIGRQYPTFLFVRVRSNAGEYAGRLRSLAAAVRPDLRLRRVGPLEDEVRAEQMPLQWGALSLATVTASVLVLSCAGVFALMSVVVTQRRREIGIRAALGADPRRLLWALFSRASAQVGTGVVIGLVASVSLDWALARGDLLGAQRVAILLGVSAAMGAFAMFAMLVPARTALRIAPTEALKAE
jgi:predicted permease